MFKYFKDEVEYHDIFGNGHGLLKVTALTLFRLAILPLAVLNKLYVWAYYSDEK